METTKHQFMKRYAEKIKEYLEIKSLIELDKGLCLVYVISEKTLLNNWFQLFDTLGSKAVSDNDLRSKPIEKNEVSNLLDAPKILFIGKIKEAFRNFKILPTQSSKNMGNLGGINVDGQQAETAFWAYDNWLIDFSDYPHYKNTALIDISEIENLLNSYKTQKHVVTVFIENIENISCRDYEEKLNPSLGILEKERLKQEYILSKIYLYSLKLDFRIIMPIVTKSENHQYKEIMPAGSILDYFDTIVEIDEVNKWTFVKRN